MPLAPEALPNAPGWHCAPLAAEAAVAVAAVVPALLPAAGPPVPPPEVDAGVDADAVAPACACAWTWGWDWAGFAVAWAALHSSQYQSPAGMASSLGHIKTTARHFS